MDFEFTADDLQGFEMYCDDNENNQVNKFQDFSICGSSDNKKLPVNEFQDLSLYCSSDNENNQNDDNQLPQIKYHESDGYNPGNILDNVHPHAIVDYSDEKTAQFMTHKLTSEEMYNKISKNPWYNVNHNGNVGTWERGNVGTWERWERGNGYPVTDIGNYINKTLSISIGNLTTKSYSSVVNTDRYLVIITLLVEIY
eukprot:13564_1